MAKQIETSLETFARRDSHLPWTILSAVVVVSLLLLLILSASTGDLTFAGLTLVALIAAGVFSARNLLDLRRSAATVDRKNIDWETAQPDLQRQSLNIEVFELSKILEVESEQISDLQSAYIVASDLALRQIQQDEGIPLMRHVTVAKTPFDAVMVKNEALSCIDVSFLIVPDIRQEKIDAMMRKIGSVKRAFTAINIGMKVRLMIVLVTQLTPEDEGHLRSALSKQRFEETPVDVDIRLLDFETLQKIYVTE